MRTSLSIPPGLYSDDTSHQKAGFWRAGSNVRFRLGMAQVIGGWESLTGDLLKGVCRTVLPWSDNVGTLNMAFGTHSHLQVWVGGGLYDITPELKFPSKTLSSAPLTVADGSATVTLVHKGHGLATGAGVVVSGAVQVGRIAPNGTFSITVLDKDSYQYTYSSNADLAETLGTNPLAVTSGSPTVTVTDTAHGIPDGTMVTISGASAVGGITPNGAFQITVINANSYRYTFTANASSNATGGGAAVVVTVPATGGGVAVKVAPQNPFEIGSIDGTGSAGFGTGTYGTGGYSEPSTEDYFPRTWALAPWGQQLLANPRAGTIFVWENDTAQVATPLSNAPSNVTHMVVAAQDQVFALGCNEEVSGVFNPICIRHSSVRKNNQWHTAADTTAREYILPGGGRIVAGRVIGPYLLVWTTNALFLGQYVGTPQQVWRFDRVGDKCGLIGPNAVVVVGQQAIWIGPDLQFYGYGLGGAPQPIPCPVRSDFVDNLAASQADKIVASSISQFSEIRFDYPDARDGFENSRYVALCLAPTEQGAWYGGEMTRTAAVDAGPSSYPCMIRPVFAGADEGLIVSDAGDFELGLASTIDLGAVAGVGKWSGGYIQRVDAGLRQINFTTGDHLTYSYSRGGAATALSASREVKKFAADEIRMTDRGVLIEESATNTLLRSEELGNSAWVATNVTITSNAVVAPDGTMTADRLEDTSSVADSVIYQTNVVPNDTSTRTFSIYLKAGNLPTVEVSMAYNTGALAVGASALVNFSTMTASGEGLVSFEVLSGGWCRVAICCANNATGNLQCLAAIRPAGPNIATTLGYCYAWGAQLEAGGKATSYIPTIASAVTRGADALNVDPGSLIYWHERGRSADGAPLSWFIESADQSLELDRSTMIRAIWPDFKDQAGPVMVTLTGRNRPQGDEIVVASPAMAPGDEKIDVRTTARLFRVKFAGSSMPAACRIGSLVFDTARAWSR